MHCRIDWHWDIRARVGRHLRPVGRYVRARARADEFDPTRIAVKPIGHPDVPESNDVSGSPVPFGTQARSLERSKIDPTFIEIDLQAVVATAGDPRVMAEHLAKQSGNVPTDRRSW
ncbi:hypothetical protein GCM10010402_12000 [Actinomadura luteofluorescens]